jgi:hypothetical protein
MKLEDKINRQHTNPRVLIDQAQTRVRGRRPRHRSCRPASASGDRGEPSGDKPPRDDGLIRADRLYAPKEVARLEGCSVARIYQRLATGEYEAWKDGASTRVLGSSILARREKKLRVASFKAPQLQPNRFHTIKTPQPAAE